MAIFHSLSFLDGHPFGHANPNRLKFRIVNSERNSHLLAFCSIKRLGNVRGEAHLKKMAIFALSLIISIIIGSMLSVLWSTLLIEKYARGRLFDDSASIPSGRVGLLLGCPQRLSDGRANPFFRHRAEAAAELYQSRKIAKLIISGDERAKETSAMQAALLAMGVPAAVMTTDGEARRTLDSIVRMKKIFGHTEAIIISQGFHNPRALYIARHWEIDAVGFNAKGLDFRGNFYIKLRELLARVKTMLDIHICHTRPNLSKGPAE
jgi:SanA protein